MKRLTKTLQQATLIAIAALASPHPASAQDIKAGELTIEQPWTRASLAGSKVAGGFMTITNNGKTSDRLIGGSSEASNVFEVHEMAMVEGKMIMREIKPGLEIKPGGSVVLKPGSYHVMFIDLKQPLKAGDKFKSTLRFEKAGTVDVTFAVKERDSGQQGHGGPMKGKH